MTADEEDEHVIAQANEPLDENGNFVGDRPPVARRTPTFGVPASSVDYMDVSRVRWSPWHLPDPVPGA